MLAYKIDCSQRNRVYKVSSASDTETEDLSPVHNVKDPNDPTHPKIQDKVSRRVKSQENLASSLASDTDYIPLSSSKDSRPAKAHASDPLSPAFLTAAGSKGDLASRVARVRMLVLSWLFLPCFASLSRPNTRHLAFATLFLRCGAEKDAARTDELIYLPNCRRLTLFPPACPLFRTFAFQTSPADAGGPGRPAGRRRGGGKRRASRGVHQRCHGAGAWLENGLKTRA